MSANGNLAGGVPRSRLSGDDHEQVPNMSRYQGVVALQGGRPWKTSDTTVLLL